MRFPIAKPVLILLTNTKLWWKLIFTFQCKNSELELKWKRPQSRIHSFVKIEINDINRKYMRIHFKSIYIYISIKWGIRRARLLRHHHEDPFKCVFFLFLKFALCVQKTCECRQPPRIAFPMSVERWAMCKSRSRFYNYKLISNRCVVCLYLMLLQ